jgi:hypothetical protein
MGELRFILDLPEIEDLMASVQELQQNVGNLSDKLDAMRARVTEDVQALRDLIAAQSIDQAVVDDVNALVDRIAQGVDSIDPDPNTPAPPARAPVDETPTE